MPYNSLYNPDLVDDLECREARRIEREIIEELSWRVEREKMETILLCDRIRDLTERLNRLG